MKRLLKKIKKAARQTFWPADARARELIQLLRGRFLEELGPIKLDTCESEAHRTWSEWLNQLREEILHEDPRFFLQWDVIGKTMFIPEVPLVEVNTLKSLKDFNTRWAPALRESKLGNPSPCVYYPESSANLLHHAYHLAVFEETQQKKISDFSCIFEFGGGYGSMCRLAYQLGFRGKYIIFDFPHFSALQEYYLKSLGLTPRYDIQMLSSEEALKDSLSQPGVDGESLFLATWSYSESPVSLRQSLLSVLKPMNYHLIAYQEKFKEVDNCAFFEEYKNEFHSLQWTDVPINHIPGNRYLMGSPCLMEVS